MYTSAYQILLSYAVLPLAEFSAIVFLVLITYLAVHNLYSHWHQLIKFSLAILLGTTGYALAKFVLLVVVARPILLLGFGF